MISAMVLTNWLREQRRASAPYTRFRVVDLEAVERPSNEVMEHLENMLSDALFAPGFLRRVAEKLTWRGVYEKILARRASASEKVKRGDFGEALFGAILVEFHDYLIPVPKLRFKVTPNQTLTGTDTLALRLTPEGEIGEVCFVESKLRTNPDRMVAVEGCAQLVQDYDVRLPDILEFIAQRLHERNDT